jgi:hypothetical protein
MRLAQVGKFFALAALVSSAAWYLWVQAADHQRERRELLSRLTTLEARAPRTERVIERQSRVEVREVAAPPESNRADGGLERGDSRSGGPGRGRLSSTELAVEYAAEFEEEPVDTTWAREAGTTYLQAIESTLPAASRLESFECRSKFCDLSVVHPDIDTSNDFIQNLFGLQRQGPLLHTAGGFRAGAPVPTPDGKLAYHLYIARPGTSLALADASGLSND